MHAIPRKVLATVAPAVVVLGLSAAMTAQGNSGNYFVSTSVGDVPGGNLFRNREAPFLNGGPNGNAKCSSNGLADGDYYFQVTDPSGRMLLSSDPIGDRRFRVSGGKIVSVSEHLSTGGRCGDVLVQLFPFEPTPNREGDYKVWVVPANQYAASGGSFGFLQKVSKTHNFKVVVTAAAPAEVDSDGDGILDFYDHCPFFHDPANTCYSGQ